MKHPLPEKLKIREDVGILNLTDRQLLIIIKKLNTLISYLQEREESTNTPKKLHVKTDSLQEDWQKEMKKLPFYKSIGEANAASLHFFIEQVLRIENQKANDKAYAAGHKEGIKHGIKVGVKKGQKEEFKRMKLQWIKTKEEIHGKFQNMEYKVSDLLEQLN